MTEDYRFLSWLDDTHCASEILGMVADVGYADTVKSLRDSYVEWLKSHLDESEVMTVLLKGMLGL